MTNLETLIVLLIIFLGTINLFRMAAFLIGSDIYSLKSHINRRKKSKYIPTISVVIPAFNEQQNIVNCVSSVLGVDYPKDKLEVIVVNDGSKDATETVLKKYLSESSITTVKVINQTNRGKANALNNGIKNHSTGELIMCLDADSFLSKSAIINAVKYFEKDNVMALASNVKIAKGKGLINLIQVFEYIISYQMKKALTVYNVEYIIGGVGSLFRRSFLQIVNYYDEDTVTEDIDLTMKILQNGNKNVRVIYGSDVVSYTPGALTISDLLKQRYRWKWGRYQAFLKNKNMFFSAERKFTKGLSWFYLPFALFSDFAFLFEPIMIGFMLYLVILKQDIFTIISVVSITAFYISMNILREETISLKDKFKLILFSPVVYLLFFTLNFVEYLALVKSMKKIHSLKASISENKCSWTPIARPSIKLAYESK